MGYCFNCWPGMKSLLESCWAWEVGIRTEELAEQLLLRSRSKLLLGKRIPRHHVCILLLLLLLLLLLTLISAWSLHLLLRLLRLLSLLLL